MGFLSAARDRRGRAPGTLPRAKAQARLAGLLLLPLLVAGCGAPRAPSFLILDSYFPTWLVGVAVAIPLTLACRYVLIRLGIDDELPLRLLVYVCLAICFTLAFAYFFSPR